MLSASKVSKLRWWMMKKVFNITVHDRMVCVILTNTVILLMPQLPQEMVGHAHHVNACKAATRIEEIVGTALASLGANAFRAFVACDGILSGHLVHANDDVLLNTSSVLGEEKEWNPIHWCSIGMAFGRKQQRKVKVAPKPSKPFHVAVVHLISILHINPRRHGIPQDVFGHLGSMSAMHSDTNLGGIHNGVAQQNTTRALMHQVKMQTISTWLLPKNPDEKKESTCCCFPTLGVIHAPPTKRKKKYVNLIISNLICGGSESTSKNKKMYIIIQVAYVWRLPAVFNQNIASIYKTCSSHKGVEPLPVWRVPIRWPCDGNGSLQIHHFGCQFKALVEDFSTSTVANLLPATQIICRSWGIDLNPFARTYRYNCVRPGLTSGSGGNANGIAHLPWHRNGIIFQNQSRRSSSEILCQQRPSCQRPSMHSDLCMVLGGKKSLTKCGVLFRRFIGDVNSGTFGHRLLQCANFKAAIAFHQYMASCEL